MKTLELYSDDDKDYILQVKIKNAPMLRAMRLRGCKTAADLTRLSGLAGYVVGGYLNLKVVPIDSFGRWKKTVIKISESLGCLPEDLFPEQHINKPLKENSFEAGASLADIEMMAEGRKQLPYEDQMIEQARFDELENMLKTLPERTEKMLRMRFGFAPIKEPMTFAAIARKYSLSIERVRGICEHGLRKLRHPSRSKLLRPER